MFTRILRSPDEVAGGAAAQPASATAAPSAGSGQAKPLKLSDLVLPLGGPNGRATDLRAREASNVGKGPLSDQTARMMLADVCHFLRQVVAITSAVVESIGMGQVRKIVGPELALPLGIINEEGKMSDKPTPPEPELDRDHRKGPRGAKHPLTVLIQIAVQAGKLLEKIARGTNPLALDREPLAERQARADAGNTSRETAAMWRGR